MKLLNKLMFRHRNEQAVRPKLQRTYLYRKQVLSIFDELVTREQTQARGPLRIFPCTPPPFHASTIVVCS